MSRPDVEYPEDVEEIKAAVPEVAAFTPHLVEMLWSDFSQRCFSATFLTVNPSFTETFRSFLRCGKING